MLGTPVGGKLSPAVLEKLVLSRQGARRQEVLRGAGIGVDAAVLQLGEGTCVFSVDPITGGTGRMGELCIHVACNDLAAAGAEPVAVGLTLLVPAPLGEEYVAGFMAEADAACQKLGVAIAGGHTELVPGLPAPLVCVAALGQPWPGCRLPPGPQVGDALVLTKGAGIEGAAILATDFPERLGALLAGQAPPQGSAATDAPARGAVAEHSRLEGLAAGEVLARARSLFDSLSVLAEARIAAARGAHAMHDVTEGGVLGAVWEMTYPVRLGVEVWEQAVPVPREVAAICGALDVDPLRLVSSGSLLIATAEGEALLSALAEAGIAAAVVGRIIPSGRWLVRERGRVPIEPPEGDELWRARDLLSRWRPKL